MLVVDDEESNLKTFRRCFRKLVDMELVLSPHEALELAKTERFDVALVDFTMPGMNGVELLRRFEEHCPDMGRVLVTAYGDLPEVQAARDEGLAAAVLMKPWDRDELMTWIRRFVS